MKPSDYFDSVDLSRRNPQLYQGLFSRGYFACMRGTGKESLPFTRDDYFSAVARAICLSGYASAQAFLGKDTNRRKPVDD